MPISNTNHPPESPPQANDPPETAANIIATIHHDASQCVPQLPDLPPLDALPQTQEWSTMASNNQDNPASLVNHGTPIQDDNYPSLKAKRTRISFTYKGVQALKAFFLLNLHEELLKKIPDNLFLDIIIITMLRKGKLDTYIVQWNMTSLAIVIDESKLHTEVSKDDHIFICQLKVTPVTFDEDFPNGPPPSVASMIHRKKNQTHSILKKQHQTPNPKKKRKHVSAEQELPTSQVTALLHNKTTLQMTPKFA
jgi:hypothetical protein